MPTGLSIGDLADRSGLAVSAIRFYETHGIVRPLRNQGGHRRYGRSDLRRLSFTLIAQRLGFPLAEIAVICPRFPQTAPLTARIGRGSRPGFAPRSPSASRPCSPFQRRLTAASAADACRWTNVRSITHRTGRPETGAARDT